ncbi:hypothetical protein TURU_150504 [Turdus rufiventris]|nr:hypothetical protein TURU_150504 [Turdus rufiventris]
MVVFDQGDPSYDDNVEVHATRLKHIGRDGPIITCQLTCGDKTIVIRGMLDTGADVTHLMYFLAKRMDFGSTFGSNHRHRRKLCYRLLQDLRKVNMVMESMGALQPGMPSPTVLSAGWDILVIDLKDCFFTIPLCPKDRPKFAFMVPAVNNSEP